MTDLLNFAVITIFAREVLEGGIIIGEYRTVILRTKNWSNPEMTQQEALREITISALAAAAFALVLCVAIAIPLAVLSRDFDATVAIVIEGVSKIVAAMCILGLSLKMPKFFGLYYSKSQLKKLKEDPSSLDHADLEDSSHGLTRRSIRFNVAWNIWREVAECGVFLIPFFLTGEGIKAIPLSAVVGCVVGGLVCVGIYQANKRMKSTIGLTIFTVGLLVLLSTGLFSGGCYKFEMAFGYTPVVWELNGDFWSVDKLPMTIFKPFGYSDMRTVLQMVTFWAWLFFSLFLHWRKYKLCRKPPRDESITDCKESDGESPTEDKTNEQQDSLDEEMGEDDRRSPGQYDEIQASN